MQTKLPGFPQRVKLFSSNLSEIGYNAHKPRTRKAQFLFLNMSESDSTASSSERPERAESIHGLILARMALIFVLLLASWWWTGSYLQQSTGTFPTSLFAFFLVSIALTGLYHFAAYLNRDFTLQRRIQFFIDVLLISWLVVETGDINSPYVSLYILLICATGFLLGRIDTLAVSIASAACLIGLAILTGQSIIYSISGDVPPSRALQIVGFNTVAILFVGLMAARIAERKRIAEELRNSRENFADLHILHERIVESVETGLITTDLEGTIYGFNRAAEEISGRTAADVIGSSIYDVCCESFRSRVESCLTTAKSSEPFPLEHFESEINRTSEPAIAVRCTISPLYRRNGNISGLIVTLQDLSQIRALEASLRRADRLAAVGRMAAGLAHEIRNPLGSLSSSLQFLRERVPTDPSERSLFDVVLRESERLNGIITNFLSYARPSAETLDKEENRETDIDAALRDCLVLLKHNPKVTEAHRFNYEPPSQPIRSRISDTQVKQVMWNLLQNSVNAMPEGGDITVKLSELPGGRVQMHFEDSGPGFTAENLEHLYEPFSVAAKGTGLGLSIVHRIVNEHDGRIDVGTANGKGTRIVVELPG
jgi:two-component system sensor histidine kinase PilS (NtrC family)